MREGIAAVPAAYGAGGQAEFGKSHHPLRIEKTDLPDAVTGGAGAHGIVETEQPRFEFGQAVAAYRSEEHTSELQVLMRSSYAVFSLKQKVQVQMHIKHQE